MDNRPKGEPMPLIEHPVLLKVLDDLADLAQLVKVAMATATRALLTADVQLAEQVITEDLQIDLANNNIEAVCLDVLESNSLNRSEVRAAVACLRMSTTLERMGDLAAHVAKQARLRYPFVSVPPALQPTFQRMGELADVVVASTAEVIAAKDLARAMEITEADREMDEIHRELFGAVLDPGWADGVQAAIDVTLLSRYYERFADHGVTIARRIAFVVTGEPYGITDLGSAADSE